MIIRFALTTFEASIIFEAVEATLTLSMCHLVPLARPTVVSSSQKSARFFFDPFC